MNPEEINRVVGEKLEEFKGFLNWEAMSFYDEEENDWVDDGFLRDAKITRERLEKIFDDESSDLNAKMIAVRVEKEILGRTKKLLQEHPERNLDFEEKTDWKALNQILTVFRLKELSQVKITKKGGRGKGLRFDATELSRTFFGKKILKGLGLTRRRVLQADELEKVKQDCARLKLTLPEIVEPTTTEKFFSKPS